MFRVVEKVLSLKWKVYKLFQLSTLNLLNYSQLYTLNFKLFSGDFFQRRLISSKHIGARDVAKILAVIDNHDVVFV